MQVGFLNEWRRNLTNLRRNERDDEQILLCMFLWIHQAIPTLVASTASWIKSQPILPGLASLIPGVTFSVSGGVVTHCTAAVV